MIKAVNTISLYSGKELSIALLKIIAAGALLVGVLALPGLASVITLFQPKNRSERTRLYRATQRLHSKGLIVGHRGKVRITEKGRKSLADHSLWDIKMPKSKQWDKKWRLVLFDIPVKKERSRQIFRRRLNELGFKPYQKSAFIYPFECRDVVAKLISLLYLESCVKYLEVSTMQDESRLRDMFKL